MAIKNEIRPAFRISAFRKGKEPQPGTIPVILEVFIDQGPEIRQEYLYTSDGHRMITANLAAKKLENTSIPLKLSLNNDLLVLNNC